MEVRSFNCELAVANMLFKNIFSNIRIDRSNANGEKKTIIVNCQLGLRSRIMKSWQNSNCKGTMRLPMIAINRTGYSRDPSRVNDMHNEVKYEITSKNRVYDYMIPVPINISYEVSIIARDRSDIDQIASNFMVFFNSSIYVSCMHPKYEGIKLNNQVIMEDSVSEEFLDEIDGSLDDFITATFSFTYKTFLFAGMQKAKKKKDYVISSYVSSFISSEVIEINYKDIDLFLKDHPTTDVSATLTSYVTEEITSYVVSGDSDDVYEDLVPEIKTIQFGFYPTPTMSDFVEYMYEVDNVYENKIYDISGYLSTDQSGVDHYTKMNSNGTIYPYVDQVCWIINGASPYSYPDNIEMRRPFEL